VLTLVANGRADRPDQQAWNVMSRKDRMLPEARTAPRTSMLFWRRSRSCEKVRTASYSWSSGVSSGAGLGRMDGEPSTSPSSRPISRVVPPGEAGRRGSQRSPVAAPASFPYLITLCRTLRAPRTSRARSGYHSPDQLSLNDRTDIHARFFEGGRGRVGPAEPPNQRTEDRLKATIADVLDDLLPEAFATVKDATRRLMGSKIEFTGTKATWDMIPYDV